MSWDFPGDPVAPTLQAPTLQGAPGLIPGQGTRPHMLQLKIPCAITKMEDLRAAAKTPCSQVNTHK